MKIKVTCKGADLLPIDLLEEFQGDLKKISKKNLEKLKKRIIKDGINVPLFVWRQDDRCRILDGHQRLKALLSLRQDGYELPLLPVVYIEAENEKDARQKLLGITSQYGEFEIEQLDEWLSEFDDEIKDTLRIVNDELKIKIKINDIDSDPQFDKAEELKEKWGIEYGQIWKLGEHKIMCGDSSKKEDVEKIMAGEKAVLIFTDPPYGVNIADKNKMLDLHGESNKSKRNKKNIINDNINPIKLKEIIKPSFENMKNIVAGEDCSFFVTTPQGGELALLFLEIMKEIGLPIRHILIWVKNSSTFSMGRLDYDYQHEPILFTWRKKHKRPMLGMHRTSIWKIDKSLKSPDHPTMKPVELIVNALLNNSDSMDVVYDGFLGSGSTLIACESTNRKCRAIEIEPCYIAVSIQRWVDVTGGKPEKLC